MENNRERDEELLCAYYAGFNQAHYSLLHPDVVEPIEMTRAAKLWYEKKYHKDIHIHHSGCIVDKEGDEIWKESK